MAFRLSWKNPDVKHLLHIPGVSAASGDVNTVVNAPSAILSTNMEVDAALSSMETKYSLKFKEKQIQAIKSIVSGKDIFVVLPTGYILFTNIEKLHLLFAK
jgi:hypothetical protein